MWRAKSEVGTASLGGEKCQEHARLSCREHGACLNDIEKHSREGLSSSLEMLGTIFVAV